MQFDLCISKDFFKRVFLLKVVALFVQSKAVDLLLKRLSLKVVVPLVQLFGDVSNVPSLVHSSC